MIEAAYVLLFVLIPLTIVVAVLLTKEVVMSEVQVAVDEVTAVLVKAKGEIVAEIAALEEAVKAGVTPDLTALKAVAESLDAIVPDVVVEEPVVEDEVTSEEV